MHGIPSSLSLDFDLPGTTSTLQDHLNLIVCFALLARLPNEALTEVVEHLRDAMEYYRLIPEPTPPQLPSPSRSASKGKTIERQPLIIDDEG